MLRSQTAQRLLPASDGHPKLLTSAVFETREGEQPNSPQRLLLCALCMKFHGQLHVFGHPGDRRGFRSESRACLGHPNLTTVVVVEARQIPRLAGKARR